MSSISKVNNVFDIGFRVHTPNLLHDIILHQLPERSGVLFHPLNQFQRLISLLAERAAEINDPELNIICLSLALYEADPRDVVTEIENQIKLMKKTR